MPLGSYTWGSMTPLADVYGATTRTPSKLSHSSSIGHVLSLVPHLVATTAEIVAITQDNILHDRSDHIETVNSVI